VRGETLFRTNARTEESRSVSWGNLLRNAPYSFRRVTTLLSLLLPAIFTFGFFVGASGGDIQPWIAICYLVSSDEASAAQAAESVSLGPSLRSAPTMRFGSVIPDEIDALFETFRVSGEVPNVSPEDMTNWVVVRGFMVGGDPGRASDMSEVRRFFMNVTARRNRIVDARILSGYLLDLQSDPQFVCDHDDLFGLSLMSLEMLGSIRPVDVETYGRVAAISLTQDFDGCSHAETVRLRSAANGTLARWRSLSMTDVVRNIFLQ